MKAWLCSVLGFCGGCITAFFGGWDTGLKTVLIFMALDFISGIIVGAVFKKSPHSETGGLTSGACWRGLWRKCGMLFYIIVGHRLDILGGLTVVRDGVIITICINEVISLAENLKLMGVWLPKPIETALDLMRKENKNDDKTDI